MSGNSAAFIGSIPKDYDQGLGPVIFADYARVMAQRAVAGPVSRVLETACGTGILTRALLDAAPKLQGERRAIAEHGEYTAADGKFVMSGGTPTIFDASEGTTTGHQLTFFLADATIIVDSENGSRTLTKHRVEK